MLMYIVYVLIWVYVVSHRWQWCSPWLIDTSMRYGVPDPEGNNTLTVTLPSPPPTTTVLPLLLLPLLLGYDCTITIVTTINNP